MRVVLIDDQEEVRQVLRRALLSFGLEVREADNGRSGLLLCNEWKPQIILTDIFMPEQDGLETIRILRKSCPRIPIIAISGGGDMGHLDVLRAARAMGAAAVLTKPFSMDTLRKTIREIMPLPAETPSPATKESSRPARQPQVINNLRSVSQDGWR